MPDKKHNHLERAILFAVSEATISLVLHKGLGEPMEKQRRTEQDNLAAINPLLGASIKQTARTYGLTIDALYYYERIGLVVPARNPVNGYRIYRGGDFFRLNIITELSGMGFSLTQIKDYLATHSLSSTMKLMNDELSLIDAEIRQLNEKKASVFESMQRYASAIADARSENITITHIPKRECLLVSEDTLRYDIVPRAFAACAIKHGVELGALHTTPCYLVDTSRPLDDLGCFVPYAILLYSEMLPCKADFKIEAGLYASCTFQGSFREIARHSDRISAYIKEQGYQEEPGALEFCLIGEYESHDQSEYVSRLEIPVSPISE